MPDSDDDGTNTVQVECSNPPCDEATQISKRFARDTAAWYCSDTCRDEHKSGMQGLAEHEACRILDEGELSPAGKNLVSITEYDAKYAHRLIEDPEFARETMKKMGSESLRQLAAMAINARGGDVGPLPEDAPTFPSREELHNIATSEAGASGKEQRYAECLLWLLDQGSTADEGRPDLYRLLEHLDNGGDLEIEANSPHGKGLIVTVTAGQVQDTVKTANPGAGLHDALSAAVEKVLQHLGEQDALEQHGKGGAP